MEPEKKSNGAIIGLVVIIIILVIGGVYMWQSNKNAADNTQSQALTAEDTASLNTLQNDVGSTDSSTGVDANTVN